MKQQQKINNIHEIAFKTQPNLAEAKDWKAQVSAGLLRKKKQLPKKQGRRRTNKKKKKKKHHWLNIQGGPVIDED